jgi:hypothetical protein
MMTNTPARVAAIVYAVASGAVVVFQLALALGVPLGSYAMGAAFPGRYPPAMRAGALLAALMIASLAAVVLACAGVVLPGWSTASRKAIWLVVALMAVALVLNLITPSGGERAVWAPVALVLVLSSLVVALRSDDVGARRGGPPDTR